MLSDCATLLRHNTTKRLPTPVLDYYNITVHSLVCNKLSNPLFVFQ